VTLCKEEWAEMIEFGNSNGDITLNPDINLIKHQILNGDAVLWHGGSGQSMIKYKDEHEAVIYLMMDEDSKEFYLELCNDAGYYITRTSSSYKHTVEIWVGGEPRTVPKSFLTTKETTWKVVSYFCESGKPFPGVEWVHSKDICWNYGLPNDDDKMDVKTIDDIF
jgi:hypothetical protein